MPWNNSAPGVVANRANIAAQTRLQTAQRLAAGGGAPAPVGPPAPAPVSVPTVGWKNQVAGHLAALGQPVSKNNIHGAVDNLVKSGRFTAGQGEALKAHDGNLIGKAGQSTMHAVAKNLMNARG